MHYLDGSEFQAFVSMLRVGGNLNLMRVREVIPLHLLTRLFMTHVGVALLLFILSIGYSMFLLQSSNKLFVKRSGDTIV